MAENKTKQTVNSVTDFINSVPDEKKRNDSFQLVAIMKEQTGFDPHMWGTSIIGFGSYHYKYQSGHEGDAPFVGFSPRAAAISLYIDCDFNRKRDFLQDLGKHKTGKGCIYVKKLDDINIEVLKEMIVNSIKYYKELYPV